MQGMLRIVGTLAVLGVALIGILVALGLITGIAAPDILVKTAWEAPEFYHHTKSFWWMVIVWLVALVAAALVVWSYRLSFLGILTSLVPLAAALALTTQGRLHPEVVRISLDDAGVTVKGQLYTWAELKSFWLVFSPSTQTLYLETTRPIFSVVSLQLTKMDPDTVRAFLLNHLPERTDRAEELSDRLARLIKF